MLDIKLLRADPQAVAGRLKVKGFELDVALFEQLEGERLVVKLGDVSSAVARIL